MAPSFVWCQQTNAIYPDLYTLYDANMYLANPAYIPEHARADIAAFYKFQTGIFKEVSTLNFSAAKLYERTNKSIHSLRLTLFNERQGPYISSPRAYFNYGYELSLGKETRLAGGLAIGLAGMGYNGASTTGDATEFLPDLGTGIMFKYKTLQLGIAGLQLPNAHAKTVYGMQLKRYYHFHVAQDLELSEHLKWRYYALYRALYGIPNQIWLGTSIMFKNTIGLGLVMRSNAGISVYTEIALDIDNDRFKCIFNYNSSFFKLSPSFQNSMELGLGYVLK
jgi:hypothetical protein